MAIDTLPVQINVPTKDSLVESWLQSYRIRNPEAETSEGTQPFLDAQVWADQALAGYANCQLISQNNVLEAAQGEALEKWGEREIGAGPNEAKGATGFVTVTCSAGGALILEGDEIKLEAQNLRYECRITNTYQDQEQVPIAAIDTGTQTNLDPGTVMKWTSPRPGCAALAVVATQTAGIGLSGGAPKETDDQFRTRIGNVKRDPGVSGNAAQYQLSAEGTPAVPVQKAFAFPGILGPASMGICFTLTASGNASRIPSAAQVAEVGAHLSAEFPASDSRFDCILVAESNDVIFEVRWSGAANSWVNTGPWPLYYTTDRVTVSAAVDSLNFTLKTDSGSYAVVPTPAVGQVLAFFDNPKGLFRRKQIKTVTGAGPWVIVCETINNASDETYVPVVDQRAAPWSNALNTVAASVIEEFNKLGPGEQFAAFPDPGLRKRRAPAPSITYPQRLSNAALQDAVSLPSIESADVLSGADVSPTVGVPGVSANLVTLGNLSIFPE